MTDEQSMLRDSIRSLVSKRADSSAVRSAIVSETGYDGALWSLLCEQVGAAALVVPERFDGADGSLAEAVIVLDELGSALVPSPLLGTVVTEIALLATGNDGACSRLLPGLAAGEDIGAVVVDPAVVINGDTATIVLGIVDGRVVEYDTSSLTRTPLATMDATRRLAAIDVSSAAATDLGDAQGVLDAAAILVAAEQVGAARRCLDLTVEYTSARVQFGRPIGSFQALKHRMADMYVAVEAARAMVYAAAESPTPDNAAAAAIAASDGFSAVAAEAVQMHGGIAITWENDISLYFKRAHSSSMLLSTPRERIRNLEAAAGITP